MSDCRVEPAPEPIPKASEGEGCPFCDYAGPSEVLARYGPEGYLTEAVYLIEPLNPVAEGHVLVIPERHIDHFLSDTHITGLCATVAADWARKHGFDHDYNLITSKGAAATQTVGHLHFHLIPRREGDGLALPWSVEPASDTPPEQEARCETCGSRDPSKDMRHGSVHQGKVLVDRTIQVGYRCPDPFHTPPEQEARCETCGSNDPEAHYMPDAPRPQVEYPCPDPFHTPPEQGKVDIRRAWERLGASPLARGGRQDALYNRLERESFAPEARARRSNQRGILTMLAAMSEVRDGRWVKGAPSHVLAEFLTAIENRGWLLVEAASYDSLRDRLERAERALRDAPGHEELDAAHFHISNLRAQAIRSEAERLELADRYDAYRNDASKRLLEEQRLHREARSRAERYEKGLAAIQRAIESCEGETSARVVVRRITDELARALNPEESES